MIAQMNMNMMMEIRLERERERDRGGGRSGEKGLNGWPMDLSGRENSAWVNRTHRCICVSEMESPYGFL